MSSSEKSTDTSTVEWFLVNEETGEVISAQNDILDCIEARKHTDAPTRLTDTAPDSYEQDRPDETRHWR